MFSEVNLIKPLLPLCIFFCVEKALRKINNKSFFRPRTFWSSNKHHVLINFCTSLDCLPTISATSVYFFGGVAFCIFFTDLKLGIQWDFSCYVIGTATASNYLKRHDSV